MSLIKEVTHRGDEYTVRKWGDGQIELRATTRGVDAMPPRWVGECTRHRVQSLKLNDTGIRELPESLTGCRDLELLSLDGNGLVEIPSTVPKLTRLRLLSLRDNQLERVTEDIGHLLNLEWLILTGNQSLAQLPPKVGHSWKKLRGLYCANTALPWAAEGVLTGLLRGFRLRELQLAEHGAQALPTHQSGEPAIDSLVIYCDQDREITTKVQLGWGSLCAKLERQCHHCCTPASDLDCIRLGLQNCKAVVVCLSDSLPLAILSEVLQSQKPIMAVKLYQQALPQQMEEQLSGLKAQGFLVEYQEGNVDVISQKLAELIKVGIPPEIIAQGPYAVEVYQDAVRKGVVRDPRCRMLVVGAERIGKTSLVKLLTGQEFDPQQKSTHVIDVVHVKASSSLVSWDLFQTQDGSTHSERVYQSACKIAETIKANIEKKELRALNAPSTKRIMLNSPDPVGPQSSGGSQHEQLGEEEVASLVQRELAQTADSIVSKSFIKLVAEILENGPDDLRQSAIEMSIWDFAGQGLYYTTHKVYLSSASIFIIGFDLTKGMKEPADEWIEDGFTNGQVLEFWLDSIYAHTKSFQPLSVLLVGTHAGLVDQDQIDAASNYIWNDILKEKPYLKAIVKEDFQDNFYTVENSCKLSENEEAQRLKNYIEKTIIPGIMENRPNMPLAWLNFEKKMKKFTTDNGEEKQYASLEEVKELAVECKVIPRADDEETLMTVLQFLHNLGSIIYYGKDDADLSDLVVLQPEWLLDVFKRLIIVPDKRGKFSHEWDTLRKRHILESNLMEHALGHLKETMSSIIHLMKKYHLICERVRGEKTAYYVPFVQGEGDLPDIKKKPEQLHNVPSSESRTTFFIDFKGFLPAGWFHQLVVKTLVWSEGCKGAVAKPHEPEIYYRYLATYIESRHAVSLEWMRQHQIKIILTNYSRKSQGKCPEASICLRFYEFLKRNLTELQMMGLRRGVSYEFHIDCRDYPRVRSPKCGCCPPGLQLEHCLDSEDGEVACPNPQHMGNFINVSDIRNRFLDHKGMPASSSLTTATTTGTDPTQPPRSRMLTPTPASSPTAPATAHIQPPPPPPPPAQGTPLTQQWPGALYRQWHPPAPPSCLATSQQHQAYPQSTTHSPQQWPSALYHHQQPPAPPSCLATGQLAAGYQQPLQPPVTPSYQVWAGQHHPPSQPPFSAAAIHPHQWPHHPGQPQPPPAASPAPRATSHTQAHHQMMHTPSPGLPAWAGTPPQSTSPWQPQPPYGHQPEAPRPPPPSHHRATGSTTAIHGQAAPSRPDTVTPQQRASPSPPIVGQQAHPQPPPPPPPGPPPGPSHHPDQGFRESLQVETSGGGASSVTHIHVEGTYAPHAQFTGPAVLARDQTTVTINSPAGGQQGE